MKTLTCLAVLVLAVSSSAPASGQAPPAERPKAISIPVRTVPPSPEEALKQLQGGATPAVAAAVPTNLPTAVAPVISPTPTASGATPAAPASSPPVRPLTSGSPTAVPPSPTPPTVVPSGTSPKSSATPGSVPSAFPAFPGTGATSAGPGAAAGSGIRPKVERILPAGAIKFQNMALEQVLEIYADLTGRTVLRSPAVVGTTQITLKSQTELTTSEAIQAIDSVLALNQVTIIPVGEKFLTVVPMAQALQEAAAFSKVPTEDLPEASQYVTKVLQLTHLKPSEVMPAIQPFAKIAGGILPIDSTQVLIIRDNAINVKRMLEIIEKIDVMVPLEEKFEVIPIRSALVTEVATVLGSLTAAGPLGTTTGRATSTTQRPPGSNPSPFGGTGISGQAGQQGAPGQPGFGAQQQFGGAIQPPGASQAGSSAASFQQRLQQIVGAAARAGQSAPLLGEAKIIPYERSNSLLVLGKEAEIALIKKLIEKLDVVQQQVLIEAIVVDVTIGGSLDLGVNLLQNPISAGSKVRGFGGGKNATIPFASQVTTNLAGSLSSGFSYYGLLGKSWEAAIQAIARNNNARVLQRPRIQTSHAEAAQIFVGETRPYVTSSFINNFGGGGSQSTYAQLNIGVGLNVLPLINPGGLVVLDISQQIESVNGTTRIDNNDVPNTTRRTISAKVAVMDGETILLGGHISTTRNKTQSGVPFLKDIPGLGLLFRNTKDEDTRSELIVLMRPTVLPTPEAASLAALSERYQMPGVRMAEFEFQREERERLKEAALRETRSLPNPSGTGSSKPILPIDLFEVLK